MKRNVRIASIVLVAMAAAGISLGLASSESQGGPKEATSITEAINDKVAEQLPFDDIRDFEDAHRGFIATLPEGVIKTDTGRVVWDLGSYRFLDREQPPATVNPGLWRLARLNLTNGLFRVTDRIYQVRGFDASNMTIIEGETGLIIVDPLISAETAKAALDLYRRHRANKPVVAVIHTHSHYDHFGGVKGVTSKEEVKAGKVQVIAPDGFLEEAILENVFAGNAMNRRSLYMFGMLLPRGEKGQVDVGLGKTLSRGTVTLIPPTDLVRKTGETRTVDGVEMVFQMAPGTEAPAEMLIFFPRLEALCAAEDAVHTLHNLYTLRGAQVRDAVKWWKALDQTIELFGDRAEVVFAQHQWPTWGPQKVVTFLKKQRDTYKYIHDQTLRLMNSGYTMTEVGEMVTLPASLAREWYNRGYYGTVNHNAKAVYQRYLGWYDSNPANLYPLPPEEAAKKYVEFMGGASQVIEKATAAYQRGEYRWVAEVMKHVVFADPSSERARSLQADAMEQLGYQAESAAWRNEFLMGAYELRNGPPKPTGVRTASPDALRAMTVEMLLDYMGILLDGPKAEGQILLLNLRLTDTGERYALTLENSVLTYTANKQMHGADATLALPKAALVDVLLGRTTLGKEIERGRASVEGSRQRIADLLALLVTFDPMFNIVTP
jgi:alkyl sulfatase BDS1-like metallo-beta-lactamase superfamily hydrolase